MLCNSREEKPFLLLFFCCFLFFKARTSMSSVLGLLDPPSPGWGRSELWLHLPLRSYLDATEVSGLCNPCACRCAVGSHFNPLALWGAPSRKRELHCSWFIRLLWVLTREQGPKKASSGLGFHNPIVLFFWQSSTFSLRILRAENASQWHKLPLPWQRLVQQGKIFQMRNSGYCQQKKHV